MAQGDMTDEEVGVKVIRECLKAWAVSDYAKAGKLLGGAPPELFERESYRRLQPISITSIGRPVVTEHTMAVLRAKCKYKVKRGGQVETIISKFAVDGVDALQHFNGTVIDLIVTDLHMPNMDGIELIKEIRAKPNYQRVPILFLTTESQAAKKMET